MAERGGDTIDWRKWHAAYDDPESALSRRLTVVRAEIQAALDRLPPGTWRVVSLCAGDGRDLLGVLEGHPRRHDASGLLVELDPVLSQAGRDACKAAGIERIEVRTGDASDASHYLGWPADLLLVCGVLGNLTEDGVFALIDRLPSLCAPGATLVWTRHRRPPDLTPKIRAALADAGFAEIAFHSLKTSWGCVGSARWPGTGAGTPRARPGAGTPSARPPAGTPGDGRLFEFVADVAQDWQRPR